MRTKGQQAAQHFYRGVTALSPQQAANAGTADDGSGADDAGVTPGMQPIPTRKAASVVDGADNAAQTWLMRYKPVKPIIAPSEAATAPARRVNNVRKPRPVATPPKCRTAVVTRKPIP